MKDKIINFIKDNKKITIIVLTIFIIFTIFGGVKIGQSYAKKQEEVKEIKKKENQEKTKKELEEYLNEMGKSWYEDFYYPQMKKNISKWKDTGVSSSLENFKVINLEGFAEKIEKFEQEGCNYEKTKVIIKPSEPFESQDYKIEIVLECGFDDYE